MDAGLPAVATVLAVLVTAVLSPWMARRASAKENARQKAENDERRAVHAESSQIDRLFREQDQMREQYREDIQDLRQRLSEESARVRTLEQEVAEWRAGIRGVHGVWVAVPSSVWTYVRDRLPELPPGRFPGESDDLPPLD